MLKPIIASTLLLITLGAVALDDLPTLEFIQHGQVVESRLMSDAEYQAYVKLQSLDQQIEQLEQPIEQFEDKIEATAERIEEQVESMIEQSLERGIGGNLQFSKQIDMSELHHLMAEIEPQIAQIKAMSEDIQLAADDFQQLILSDYRQGEIDRVRIIDGDDFDNYRFSDDEF